MKLLNQTQKKVEPMNTIKVKVNDQRLQIMNNPHITSGSVNIDFIEFDFDPSWDEFTERYCVFYLTEDDPYQVNIDDNNRCGIVQAMTENEGVFYFGVWGRTLNGDKIKTSADVKYCVAHGVPTDGATVTSWDDFWYGVKSCANMFSSKEIPPNPPIFNTYNCTSFSSMFKANTSIETVTLAVNRCVQFDYVFQNCTNLKRATLLEPSSSMTRLDYAFYNCPRLESITGEINCTYVTTFGAAFYYCVALKDLRLKGNTLSVNIDLSPCSVLSRESVLSVLAACKNIDSTHTVRFASAVYSADISTQTMAAVNKGWTVAFGSTTFTPETEV